MPLSSVFVAIVICSTVSPFQTFSMRNTTVDVSNLITSPLKTKSALFRSSFYCFLIVCGVGLPSKKHMQADAVSTFSNKNTVAAKLKKTFFIFIKICYPKSKIYTAANSFFSFLPLQLLELSRKLRLFGCRIRSSRESRLFPYQCLSYQAVILAAAEIFRRRRLKYEQILGKAHF